MFSNFGCIAAKLVVLNLLLFVDYKREKAKCFDEKIHFLQSFFSVKLLECLWNPSKRRHPHEQKNVCIPV